MKSGRKVFIIFLSLGILTWILDAILDKLFFIPGSFPDLLLLKIPHHELYIRLLILIIFILCGLVFAAVFSRFNHNKRALESSEERFRTLSDQSVLALLIYRNNDVLYTNSALAHLLDVSPDDLKGKDLQFLLNHIYSEDRDFAREQARKKMAGEPDIIPRYTFRLLTEKGNLKWVDLFSRRVMLDNEPAVFATIVNITDRISAELALSREKERLDVTLRSIGDGVIVTDPEGAVISVNRVAENLTGWNESEAIGRPLTEIYVAIDEDTRKAVPNPVESALQEGSVFTFKEPVILVSRDGTERSITDMCSVIKSKETGIIGTVLVFRDCTETRRLQEFASRAQRLETAGRIAAQVAHDFNNLLGPLTAYPALIKDDLPAGHPAIELVDQIEKAAGQMADINQQLLTLGRRGHYSLKPLNLNKIVLQAVRQFHSISDTVSIETELSDNLMNIRAGSSQIYRVLVNLISNAFDAMGGTGKLKFRTENFYVDRISELPAHIPRGEYVKLTVSDTGIGIPEDVLPRIFDPFFTTKNSGGVRGSGLGLSVVHSVVEDHGGYIDVKSKPGEGTTFYIYFPITREGVTGMSMGQAPGGNESILVVDDDAIQQEVSRTLLDKLGYSVNTAESGEKALEMLKEKEFDLLVLDMMMPEGIDGTETYRRALQIRPDQKVLLVTGYAESHRVDEAIHLGADTFLRKPVTIKTLGRAVRKVLDQPVKAK
jgi:two-component system cell cycle sensor histidine kinase/response regulator CckA